MQSFAVPFRSATGCGFRETPAALSRTVRNWRGPIVSTLSFCLPTSSPPYRSFSSAPSGVESFDIFQKIKDSSDGDEQTGGQKDKKRKPSDKVLRLVDEIMNLTLIEAADLCDLCQEKLAERSGGPNFSGAAAAGRTPFPHPSGMFAGAGAAGVPGMMPPMAMMPPMMGGMGGMPMMGAQQMAAPQAAAQQTGSAPSGEAAAPGDGSTAEGEGEGGAEEKGGPKAKAKAIVSVKLVKFDPAKKIAVIKEVRALTALGLKEAKDVVEAAPKTIKRGVPTEEAEAMKTKLEAAGCEVALE